MILIIKKYPINLDIVSYWMSLVKEGDMPHIYQNLRMKEDTSKCTLKWKNIKTAYILNTFLQSRRNFVLMFAFKLLFFISSSNIIDILNHCSENKKIFKEIYINSLHLVLWGIELNKGFLCNLAHVSTCIFFLY